MLVAINGHWKIPVEYFLLNSLNGAERASLLEKCLELIEMTRVEVHSVTFDGASANINMCKCLGANFELGTNFNPYFINPITKKKVFCFCDACHILKLVRNTLGDQNILKSKDADIHWQDIVLLQEMEEKEGLRAGTKLTKKRILYENNRMNSCSNFE